MSNKTRKIAQVELEGDSYKIVSILTSSIAREKGKRYFQLSSPLANDILIHMDRGKTAYFPKDKKTIKQEDLIYQESTDLDVRKNNEVSKYMRMISNLFVNMTFMDFFEFVVANNKFCTRGIFITDDNREEEYLKIINTGDIDLIENLERFLESFDTLKEVSKRYSKIRDLIHAINDCQSIEELEELMSQDHHL